MSSLKFDPRVCHSIIVGQTAIFVSAMASLAPPTRRAVSVRLLVGEKQLTPNIVVELQLPLSFDNVVAQFRDSLKQSLPSLRVKLNAMSSPRHHRSSNRLYILVEGTALEIYADTINSKIINDARLILSVDGHDTSQVLSALQTSCTGGMTRHVRTSSGNVIPQGGLGKRQFRSYTARLRIASDMGRYGAITPTQKALLKDLVIAGDRQLEHLLEEYEKDTNPQPLVAFLNSSSAQSARVKSHSRLSGDLSMDIRSLSVERVDRVERVERGGDPNNSFDFDAVMGMGGASPSFDIGVDPLGGFGGELYVPDYGGALTGGGNGGRESPPLNNGFEDDLSAVLRGGPPLARHSRQSSALAGMGSTGSVGSMGSMGSGHKVLQHSSSSSSSSGGRRNSLLPPQHRRGGMGKQGSGSSDFGNHSFGMASTGHFGSASFMNGVNTNNGGGGGVMCRTVGLVLVVKQYVCENFVVRSVLMYLEKDLCLKC